MATITDLAYLKKLQKTMKNLLIIVLLLVSITSYSQSSIGLTMGVNTHPIPNIHTVDMYGRIKSDFYLGMKYHYQGKKTSIQFGGNYLTVTQSFSFEVTTFITISGKNSIFRRKRKKR